MWMIFNIIYFFFLTACATYDETVTYSSVIKLKNIQEGVRLHSHDIKYGSGSGQQSVTGMIDLDDVNSHWQILAAMNASYKRGQTVKCGDLIRLKHTSTGCFLHSHLFSAPLSNGNQEISCFTEGDTGDHWVVVCNTDEWLRDGSVKLKHKDTGKYLATSGHQYSRPISGQREVVGVSSPGNSALWRSMEGIYMLPKQQQYRHDEF
ncbi:unnamed protein product [Dracunculus medinensis]|uniref:MIR domain-containing protein n=1 Tax=Dracunculus medinensis TaxID=318479 RepID=A0A0N4UAN2_DRAME|nr:unnamed protein product [Dracunculus medinensis]